jgi:hypothetical protein
VSLVTRPRTEKPMDRSLIPALTVQTGCWAYPALYSVGTGVKQPAREADHLPPFIVNVKHEQC